MFPFAGPRLRRKAYAEAKLVGTAQWDHQTGGQTSLYLVISLPTPEEPQATRGTWAFPISKTRDQTVQRGSGMGVKVDGFSA
jgi:hypothetical protein